jgi:hypothetical protein
MIKYIFSLITLVSSVAIGALTDFDRAEMMHVNRLVNPGFEAGRARWTYNAGTATLDTTGQFSGSRALSISLTTVNGDVLTQSVTPAAPLTGVALESSMRVKTTSANVQVCALQAGVEISCSSVPSTGLWTQVVINYIGPTSGTIGVKLKTTSSTTATVGVDDGYVGTARNLGTVSQATLYGRAVWTATTSCSWAVSQTTYANYAVDADCTTPVGASLSNFAQAPATKVPGFTFASLPPGDYFLVARGLVYKNNSVNDNALVRWHDGTNGAGDQIVASANGVGALGATGNVTGSFTYTTAQSNVTFQLQARNLTTAGAIEIQANVTPLVLELYRYPTSAEQAVRSDILPASWNGTIDAASGWTTTSATFADLSAGVTITSATLSSRNITCSAAGSSLAGILCTLPRAGLYQVCVSGAPLSSSGAANAQAVRITDGAGVVIHPGMTGNSAGSSSLSICGNYLAPSGSSTFKVQGAISGGATLSLPATFTGQSRLTWSVVAIDAAAATPILVGSVGTSSAGIERVERVRVGTVCSVATCTITDSTPSVTSVTRGAVGNYSVNFASGTFSAAPTCTVLTSGVGNTTSAINSESSTVINFLTFAGSTAASTDVSFRVMCVGPR